MKPTSPYRRPVESSPGPGHHNDSHLTPFGADITHKMDFGNKYKTKFSDTPSPTKYRPNDSILSTKKRSIGVKINSSTTMVRED